MFVLVMTARVTDPAQVREHLDRWVAELAPGAQGWLGNTAGGTADGVLVLLARFASREACLLADARPEHKAWETGLVRLFAEPPVILESTSVDVYTPDDPSKAGFVQVVQGRSRDPEQVRRLFADARTGWKQLLPGMLGSVTLGHPDGGWTTAIYVAAEAAGASPHPLPHLEELMEQVEHLSLSELVHLDLADPWLHAPR